MQARTRWRWCCASGVLAWGVLLPATVSSADDLHTWTDSSASFNVRAKYDSVEGDTVVLLREDGKRIAVPMHRLSAADQDYVKARHSAAAPAAAAAVPSETAQKDDPDHEPSDAIASRPNAEKAISGNAADRGAELRDASAATSSGSAGRYREWTDSSGAFSVRGRFIEESRGFVTLEREDGKRVRVALSRLAAADRAKVAELSAAEDPFEFVEEGGGGAATATADDGQRMTKVDWSKARNLGLTPRSNRWKLPVERPAAEAESPWKAVTLPARGSMRDRFLGGALSVAAKRLLLAYGGFGSDEACNISYTLVDFNTENVTSLHKSNLPRKMLPLALNAAGDRALMRFDVFGGGKSNGVEIWDLSSPALRRLRGWIAYDDDWEPDRDVKWGAFYQGERALTISEGGKLVGWNTATGQPIFQTTADRGLQPALSPDGHWLAFVANKFLYALNLERVEIAVCKPIDAQYVRQIRFSPDGARLALCSAELQVIDFATGETLVTVPPTEATIHDIEFVASGYLLAGGELFDLEHCCFVWRYEGIDFLAPAKDQMCLVGDERSKPGVAMLQRLPQDGVREKVAAVLARPDFWIAEKGTKVRVDASRIENLAEREKAEQALKERLEQAGFEPAEQADVVLEAATQESRAPRAVQYGNGPAFGLPPFLRRGETLTIREFISSVRFVYKGQTAWERTRSSVPQSVSVKVDESLAQALQRYEKPDYRFFREVELATRVRNPECSGALGQSEITPSGMRDVPLPKRSPQGKAPRAVNQEDSLDRQTRVIRSPCVLLADVR